jgi:hypothetical protein
MKNKWYLGEIKDSSTRIYLEDFEWQCGWYWAGGYIVSCDMHCHFDGCFLKTPDIRGHSLGNFTTPWNKKENSTVLKNGAAVWESLSFFLDDPQYTESEWWRIKDLFKQFYTLRDAAEIFTHGGNCTTKYRTKKEINKCRADGINKHIETVIIPLIRDAMDHKFD